MPYNSVSRQDFLAPPGGQSHPSSAQVRNSEKRTTLVAPLNETYLVRQFPSPPSPAPNPNLSPTRVPLFLDAEEAAAYLGGMNSRTVVRWAREGYLPAFPIGEGKRRLWRFLASDLESWLLSRRTGGTLTQATDAPTKGRFLQ